MQQLNLIKAPPPKKLILRPYQAQAIDDLIEQIKAGYRRILMYQSCGAGKTIIAAELIRRTVEKTNRLEKKLGTYVDDKILFAVHLDALVGQTYDKLKLVGVECGFIKAGWAENPWARVQIGSLQTMAKRKFWHKFNFTVIHIDECHLARWHKQAQRIIDMNPNAVELGWTATPLRTSSRQGMGDHYDSLVAGPMPIELRNMGFLSHLRYFGLPQADLSGVRRVKGDFDSRALSVVCDRPDLVKAAADEWFRLGRGKRTIAFCVDTTHAMRVAEEFKRRGVSAAYVLGDTPIEQRKRLYAKLRSGEILVLTSCNVISIGFDEPSVEVGLMLRPTQSLALWYQQLGRIQRPSPETGKEFGIIIDQSGNSKRLGPIEHFIRSSISLARGRTFNFDFDAVMKTCPSEKRDENGKTGCGHLMLAFRQSCPECGYIFPVDNWIQQTGQLEELILDVSPVQREFFVKKVKDCIAKGRSPGQAAMAFKRRFYKHPKAGHTRRALYDATTKENVDEYFKYLSGIARRRQKGCKFVKTWMTKEFDKDWKALIPEPDLLYKLLAEGKAKPLASAR